MEVVESGAEDDYPREITIRNSGIENESEVRRLAPIYQTTRTSANTGMDTEGESEDESDDEPVRPMSRRIVQPRVEWTETKDEIKYESQDEMEVEDEISDMTDATDSGNESDYESHLEIPMQECSVCMEELYLGDYPQKSLTNACNHENTVCNFCVTEGIDSRLPDVFGDQVQRPEYPQILSYEKVKELASPQSFQQYVTALQS